MGRKSGFSLFGLFKSKPKKVWHDEEDYTRDDVFVNKAYKVWRSDEDRRGLVALPDINIRATEIINGKIRDWNNAYDVPN